MFQSVKIIKIKDPIAANNGLRLLAILYRTDHSTIVEQAASNNNIFLLTRNDSMAWPTEDIENIKTFLEEGFELEFNDYKEKEAA